MVNDRIKELAALAGYKHQDAVGTCEDYAYFSHDLFAELIVKECCQKLENDGMVEVAIELKEHFGVTE